MPQGAQLLVMIAVLAFCGMVIGFVVGRIRGGLMGGAAARQALGKELEEAKSQARLWSRNLSDAKQGNQRMLELLINLPETVNKMGSARSMQELCRTTARALMDLVDARKIGLFLPESPTRYRLEVYAGPDRPQHEVSFAVDEGRLGRLVQMIGVRDKEELRLDPPRASAVDDLFRPDLCVAARCHDTTYAFVVMDDVQQGDSMTRRVLQMLADVCAVSAEGVRTLDQERAKAETDQLTGLFNRGHLDRRLSYELSRARSQELQVSVFLFDIDNFKHFNDHNGHQAGDDCLRQVAALTKKVTRSSDIVCRYGGEEFLVILLGAGRDQAWHHAERIRHGIATTPFPHGHHQPLGCVSISGGVASFPTDAAEAAPLVKLADQALYTAKENGRNRVYVASEKGPLAVTPLAGDIKRAG